MKASRVARPVVLCVLLALSVACSDGSKPGRPEGAPAVIAAAGDSMTRAFNVDACCALSDAPEYSWATGDNRVVDSHYRRLLDLNPDVRVFNVARSGAKMMDLERQMRLAATFKTDYLTILMGANDMLGMLSRSKSGCSVDASRMTPVSTFRSQFRGALKAFTALRPEARIMVASIPDVPRLWSIFRTDPDVVAVWDRNGNCESLLGDARSDAAVQAAAGRLSEYNVALASVCKAFKTCRWDGGATYKYPFQRADFSELDFFHPNVRGQNRLAELTWRAGYWA